jgi:hypothetical protein
MNRRLLIGFVGVVTLALPHVANAQYGVYGWPYGPCGWSYTYPYSYSNQTVPYFAMYPPVYYSYRVARTYGYSPFAYPPGVMTPGSEAPRPVIVQNQYSGSEAAGTMEGQQSGQPQRIDNPYVEDSDRSGVTKNQRPAARRTQVIYPSAWAQSPVKGVRF